MIKTSLLSAVLMTSALMTTTADAKLFDVFAKKETKVQSEALRDVYSGLKFNYYDKEDRLLIVKDFLKTLELEYALLPLKKELIGLDYKRLKAEAIAAEESIDDILLAPKDRNNEDLKEKVTFLQASSNMDFLDRMIALSAKFKDTHFGIYEKTSRPFLYTGFRLFRIDGKVVVGSLENKFLAMASKLSGADLSVIKIGDEVISIDGVPVEDKVNELKPYISGSTEEFIDSQAVRSLTFRNVKFEKKNYMRVVFKNAGAMKVPVFANNSNTQVPRLDMITYLDKYKIPSDSTSIGITFNQSTRKWDDSNLSFAGYGTRNVARNLKGVNLWQSAGGTAAVRTGYYMNKGKSYAYLQILTFSVPNVEKGDEKMPFLDAIRNFIAEVKENELPLILDLRVNNGGNGSYPAKVMSMLAKKDDVYAPSTTALRMTQYIRGLYEGELYQKIIAEDESAGVTIDMIQGMIDDALNSGADYTPMFAYGLPVVADSKIGGFNNKIVALVTADCISACDKTAFLIKASGRAKIIGTHSNGTGAGYTSTENLNTEWGDRLKVLTTTFPNYLFGKPGSNVETLIHGPESVLELCSENKPTIADIQYKSTMLDLAKDNLGWLQKATQVLDAQE